MKKFITRTILIALPILVVMIIMEVFLRAIPNTYKLKKEYLDTHAHEIEVLILGSSHTYNGLNPDYFTDKTFNAANNSQFLDFDMKIFDKYKADLKNLNTIILPISYFSLLGTMENTFEPWRIKNYIIYYNLKLSYSPKYNSEMLSNRLDANVRKIIAYYLHGKLESSSNELGWNTRYRSLNRSEEEMIYEGKQSASMQNIIGNYSPKKIQKALDTNLNSLNKLLDWGKANNVQIVFFTPPVYKTFSEHLNPEQLQIIAETMDDFTAEYDNCVYFNMLDHPDFNISDFEDSHHLNSSGAKKLSIMVNDIINDRKEEHQDVSTFISQYSLF